MRQAQLKSGKFVAIGFQWSYSPALLAAKRDFLSGKFGRAIQFKSHVLWERGWKYYARNNWAGKIRDRQGHWILDSVAHNATAHYLHNPYYMHGPALNQSAKPVSIQCELYRANDIENFDTCMLRAVTDQGCEVLYYVSHALHYNERPHFIYHFEKADLICNCDEPGFVEDCVYARYPDGTLVNYGPATPNPFSKQELCIDAILNGNADALPCGLRRLRRICLRSISWLIMCRSTISPLKTLCAARSFRQPMCRILKRSCCAAMIRPSCRTNWATSHGRRMHRYFQRRIIVNFPVNSIHKNKHVLLGAGFASSLFQGFAQNGLGVVCAMRQAGKERPNEKRLSDHRLWRGCR